MDDGSDDPRLEEIASLEAIFPEIQRPDATDPFTFILELPVKPANPVTVTFPVASSTATSSDLTAAVAAATTSQVGPGPAANGPAGPQNQIDSHMLSYLPSISLRISLPSGYPSHNPPDVNLRTTPQWLSPAVVETLKGDAHRLWEGIGRDMVVYTYIDHIQQAAEDVFGMVDSSGALEVDLSHMVALLDYDNKARRVAFENETFDCEVCLDPKKGIACHRMMDCGHVFCLSCLRDFYGEAIKQGDVNVVRCLSPGCAKAREAQARASGKKRRRATASVSPGELLVIGMSKDIVSRYVSLKYKKELESDKTTVFCPRRWCDGAAVSKRHKKPKGLELQEPEGDESDEADDARDNPAPGQHVSKTDELLAVCEDCSYAFCNRCRQSWHGEFFRCKPKIDDGELTAEEKASMEYIKAWTAPCASCDAPAQKTEGCNHMICYRCNTHFCYLCSAWLDPQNPYSHFNRLGFNECYQRLWDFEGGHGENADWRAGVNRQAPPRAVIRERPDEEPFAAMIAQPDVVEAARRPAGVDDGGDDGNDGGGPDRDRGARENIQVEREGPLVLRIEQPAARVRRDVAPAAPAAPPAVHPGRGGRRRGRGGGGGGAARPQPRAHVPEPRAQRNANANANGARGGRGGHIRQGGRAQPDLGENQPRAVRGADDPPPEVDQGGVELNEQQQAWVRRFVQLALMDEEDSGSEDEEQMGIF